MPKQEFVSAFGEIIKHGVISGQEYFNLVTSKKPEEFNQKELIKIIKKSIKIKSDIVKKDPKEKDLRKVLNFGHTIGHAIESLSWKTDKPLLHGEAVAIGMIAESKGCTAELVKKAVKNAGLPTKITNIKTEDIIKMIFSDKKNIRGEPINPEAWLWFYKHVGREKIPIMDTWWQTETGMHMITPIPSVKLKPGSAFKPFFGVEADVVDDKGNKVPVNTQGYLIIRKPWPAMFLDVYNNPTRYRETYFEKIPNVYFAGDSAKIDEDGYYWIVGRNDDVIKVSGHRLGSAELESAFVSNPKVAEAAVIGKPHEVKGESIKAFVILKQGVIPSDELKAELVQTVRKSIGPIATPDEIDFVEKLPKTRSGKIMRRVLKAQELGLPVGDTSTLDD
ncbi:hypothetical protein CANDROIZ_90001 [Candidatus Roizmanbacteria bacterium]|nr:hypothetical protein CANDROIZ_90001 [Candidatus Roizmanbacteria bacterium]